ncbi:hypothetical protein [Micromonospora sp. NPDC023814]|uniref:hypothetical protein n=1 Tax=Micromonospora sp. NPDC023814 TaxID=3154596 RepID=UPI0033CC5F7C
MIWSHGPSLRRGVRVRLSPPRVMRWISTSRRAGRVMGGRAVMRLSVVLLVGLRVKWRRLSVV